MDSEHLLKIIGYFPDYLSALSRTLLLDNLCRNSVNTNEIPGGLTRENMIPSDAKKTSYLHT